MSRRNAFLCFFRCFSLDPNIPGHPIPTLLLIVYAVVNIVTPISINIHMFFVLHIFSEGSMLAIISASFVGSMLGTQSLIVAQSLWHRRGLANVRRQLSAENNGDDIGTGLTLRLLAIIVIVFSVYSAYLFRAGISATVLFILVSMLILRISNIQSVFYVEQIGDSCDRICHTLCMAGGCSDTEHCYQLILGAKQTFARLWRTADDLNGCLSASWLIVSVQTLTEVVVNVYMISSALFTGAVPLRAITLSLYGLGPTVLTFALFCWSCDSCVAKVRRIGGFE